MTGAGHGSAARARRALAGGLALSLAAIAPAAHAGPPRALVLPLDGDADPAVRVKYAASVQRLARMLDARVAAGSASFVDSAAVVGCEPSAPRCAEKVRATLGVDELIHGTLRSEGGQLVLVVRRTGRGKPPREVVVELAADDPPERAEAALLPLFQASAAAATAAPEIEIDPVEAPPSAVAAPIAPPPDVVPPPPPAPARLQRTLGITAIAGGGTLVLIGLSLWANAAGLQDDIDRADPDDRGDFDALLELEDRASTRAWAGNAVLAAGVVLGGIGGYLLYRDRQAQRRIVVAPSLSAGGAAVTLTWIGGGR